MIFIRDLQRVCCWLLNIDSRIQRIVSEAEETRRHNESTIDLSNASSLVITKRDEGGRVTLW